ncbi:MAG: SpaA isopeptide-forming pilin-related protein, partial [Erysipelotrichaceae bacterium]|nr:SpaA isopeptide-forming pilin-related protein [Erysipelotrichaceae bacterium]
ATQTVITTQNIESLRTAVKEATISSRENVNKYTVSFKKVDKEELDNTNDNANLSNGLKGSKLQLLDYNNNPVNTVVTDTNGLATFSNLRAGAYTLKEIESPANYEKISQPMKVLVKEDGEIMIKAYNTVYSSKTSILPVPNKQLEKVTITVSKVWKNVDNPSANNATIVLYQDGKATQTKKTITGNSTVKFEGLLKYAPNGKAYEYNVVEEPVAGFTSKVEKQGDVYTITNTRIVLTGQLDFTKTEFSTDTAVKGATITIYTSDTHKEVVQGITDEQGKINNPTIGAEKVKNGKVTLEVGRYYFKETNAPAGYVLNDAPQYFEIKENEITPAKLENKKELTQENIDFTVKKVWLNPLNKEIKDHNYTLDIEMYRDGHKIETKPIGVDGTVVFANMPKLNPATNKPYNYTFEERNASIDIAQFISREVKGNEVTFINRLRGGCFDFVKHDETGAPLSGAVVGVYDARTNRLLFEGTTNEQGKLDNLTNGYQDRVKVDRRIVMEIGDYYLKEIKAPSGYELSDEKVNFTVNEYTCTPLLTIVNKLSQTQENIDFTVKKVWLNPLNKEIKDH